MAEKAYIPIFLDWDESTKRLNSTEKGRLVDALVAYAKSADNWEKILKGNERFLADELRLKIDRFYEISAKRSAAGAIGAESRWQTMANDGKSKQTMANDGTITKTKTSTSTKSVKKKKEKEKFGRYDNVLLTPEELETLKTEFPDWEEKIERLSEYIASSGKTYKNHLATIRSWARKDGVKPVKENRPAPSKTEYEDLKRLLDGMP